MTNEYEDVYLQTGKKKDQRVLKAIIITTLVITVFLGSVYFIFNEYQNVYQQGTIDGANLLSQNILDVVARCEALPITVNNQTVNLIIAECLEGQGWKN